MIVVFAYNFRHKKTQDVLVHLFLHGYDVDLVLAADPVELDIPSSTVRTKIRHRALVHPEEISRRIGAEYRVVPHDSDEAIDLLNRMEPDLGVIGGARILDREIIDSFRLGIINLHPGLIPESRGLDAMLWSVLNDVPQGVTAHLIDEHVDAGEILVRREIPIYEDDKDRDLQERLYEVELELLPEAIEVAREDDGSGELTRSVDPTTPYNRKMPGELEREVMAKLPDYVRRHATDSG